jgi:hypothetical protein
MTIFSRRCALSLAAIVALLALPTVAARADDDHYWHHDRGEHRGWYKHGYDDGPRVYYAPGPVYVAPAPYYYAPPPPVVYAPAPVYAAPSLNVIVPLHFR